jgi:intracellular sulfur oxidation DsrE/DsrF family protein
MMKDNDTTLTERRSLLNGLGMAALAGVALGSAPASAQQPAAGFQPARHTQDAWMDAIPGSHRVFIDTDNAMGGTNALRYCSNIMNAHVNGYEGSEADMAMIICYRHASTPYAFNNAMWEKYGSNFVGLMRLPEQDGGPPKVNTLTDTIAGLAAKGVHFAICNSATMMMSGLIARQAGLVQEEVLAELVANTIPNGHMVPAGVMAVTRAQEYGYSFLYSAA